MHGLYCLRLISVLLYTDQVQTLTNRTRQELFKTRVSEHGQEDSSLFLKQWKTLLRYYSKVKNVFPFHAMKVYRGIRGIKPLIFNFWSRLRWGVKFKPRYPYSGIEIRYPLKWFWMGPKACLDVFRIWV